MNRAELNGGSSPWKAFHIADLIRPLLHAFDWRRFVEGFLANEEHLSIFFSRVSLLLDLEGLFSIHSSTELYAHSNPEYKHFVQL